jgi:diguanylate cyclase
VTATRRLAAAFRWAGTESSQTAWQATCAVLVVAYCASLILVTRPASGYVTFWDGWVGNVAGTLPIVPVWLRMRHTSRLRLAWTAIAVGIAMNSIGNLVYLFHDQNLVPIPNPAPSDVPYLLSYAALIVGVAVMTQRSFGRGHASVRFDGVVAGLAIGATATMLWFQPVLKVSGSPLQVAVAMAYPLCDLVLLVLLVAGLAPQRYRPTWSTALLMVGVLWFVIGDTIYLSETTAGTYLAGTFLDGTWVIGTMFLGLAAWQSDERRSKSRRASSPSPTGIALVPVVFGLLSLVVLVVSLFRHTSAVASGMALGALGVVIVRMGLTLREVRHASENFRDARTDALTGLQNRRAFLEDAESKLGRAQGNQRVGILLVDLDGFKEVNDSLGHHSGDELLRIVGERFQRRIAHRGSLARLGGDEYGSACVVTSHEDLVAIAHELAETLSDPITLDGITVRVGASIGVSISPDHGSNYADLLRSADVAMYEAKRQQSVVCSYHAEHDLNSRDRLALIHDLRTAIEARALVLHFQPVLELRTATVRGVEALARWHHPERGLLYPDTFIPLAERVGLIPQLTRAVLEIAIAEAASLDARGFPLQMSVNISRYDLIDEQLGIHIDVLLARHNLPPERLTLEVTESCLGDDPVRVNRCIQQLRARGIRISIDDFGVGYSSMSQLLELPIDELKIDKSFVSILDTDHRANAIVSATIELARALNLVVVAEGVECSNTLRSLRRLGADMSQGYYIARPLTRDQLDDYLAQPRHHHGLLPKPVPIGTNTDDTDLATR